MEGRESSQSIEAPQGPEMGRRCLLAFSLAAFRVEE